MDYRFYSTTSDAWEGMLAAIKKAKNSIYWESYILNNDTGEHNFFEILKQKAKSGVKVKIIIDSLGSFFLAKKAIEELSGAGVEVLFYNRLIPWWNPNRFKHRWFHRNHKKILIVDQRVGFIGGVNVGGSYRHWIDLQVELRGLIVRYLIRSFIISYRLCGGTDEIKYKSVFKKSKIRVFHHSPLTEKGILKNYYKKALRTASEKIVIVTPYFIPQAWLVRKLHAALKRGVKVEVILPAKADYRIADLINYLLAALVYRPGIGFFFTKKMTHAKALLIDDKEAMVGSQNIDAYSFDYNLEGGIVFERKDMVEQLARIIEKWKAGSNTMAFDHGNKKWYQRLATGIVLFLRPYL